MKCTLKEVKDFVKQFNASLCTKIIINKFVRFDFYRLLILFKRKLYVIYACTVNELKLLRIRVQLFFCISFRLLVRNESS